MSDTETEKGQPDMIPAALFGLCPDCGQKTLFGNVTAFADQCRACGLDYAKYNVGDGPAAFLTLIVGAVVLILALVIEFQFYPPMWVHLLLWFPITIGLVIVTLRFSKALLLISEHRNEAHEGVIDEQDEGP